MPCVASVVASDVASVAASACASFVVAADRSECLVPRAAGTDHHVLHG